MQETINSKPTFTRYQIFSIAILALLQFTVVLDFMIISPLSDLLMKNLNINPAQFGSIVSSYAFSAAISGVMAAGFADKFDRKKILLFFYIGFIIGTFFCSIANNYFTMLLARIVTGLFGGVISSVSLAIVADLFEIKLRGRVMSFIQMSFAASQIMGIPLGIFISNHWGWHASFQMIVGLALIICTLIFIYLKPIAGHLLVQDKKNPFFHLWNTLSNKQYQIGFMAIAFLAIGGFMLMPFSSAFLINNVHITQHQLPLVFMFGGISSMIIMPVVGSLSDKMNKLKLFLIGSAITIVMVIIYTHMGVLPLPYVIIINMILFMGIMSRAIPANTLNTSIPSMADRGAYMSITSSLQQMAGGLAALIAGWVVKQNSKHSPIEHFDTLGFIVAAIVLCSSYFVYRVYMLVKEREKNAQ